MTQKAFESLYSRIGGDETLERAVALFYDKVLADERVRHFFEGVDMTRLRATQKLFLSYVFGGPYIYSGRAMRDVHQHLDLTEEHFQAVMEDLEATLRELGISDDLVEAAMGIASSHRDDVLNL